MNRRGFLKSIAGFSIALAGAQLAIPVTAKCKMIAPLTDLVGKTFLDKRIKDNIAKFKQDNPHLKIGETHCHSVFSDGTYSVDKIMGRAARLGLDFMIITEHVQPHLYPLEHALASIKERGRCCDEWNHPGLDPIDVYPAFELSTLQGHLILVMDKDYLKPKLIITLGAFAFRYFFPKETYKASLGKTLKHKIYGSIFPVYHPSGMNLANPDRRKKFEDDIAKLAKIMGYQHN